MENEDVLTFRTGRSTLFVYRSQNAGTNTATAVTFVAEEVDDLVRTLKSRGVAKPRRRLLQRSSCSYSQNGTRHKHMLKLL
jgi:hypothetical protein